MGTISRFEDMLVWQKARILTREVYKNLSLCRDMGFRDQIQRASVSVMSNIAEGFERGTKEEFLNYLYIAKGSAGEVRCQLYAALDIGYLNISIFKDLKNLAEECSKLLSTFISSVKKNEMRGLQRKNEKPTDWLDEEMARQDMVMTPSGLKSRSDAEAKGLAIIKDFKEIVSRNKMAKI